MRRLALIAALVLLPAQAAAAPERADSAPAAPSSNTDDGLTPAARAQIRLLQAIADGGAPDSEDLQRMQDRVEKQLEAARFFEEHQRRVEQEEANRDFIYAAVMLAAMLVSLAIRKLRQ